MNMILKCSKRFSNGVLIINTTPHDITFLSPEGERVTIPTSVKEGELDGDLVINATVEEFAVGEFLVKSNFVKSVQGEERLKKIEEYFKENNFNYKVMVVGSIIAAQAYPGRVVAMCPEKGFERVPPSEKLMTVSKFTTF